MLAEVYQLSKKTAKMAVVKHESGLDFIENSSQLLAYIGRLVEIEKPQEEDLNIKLQR